MLEYRFGVLFYEKFMVKFLLSYRPGTCTSLKLIKVRQYALYDQEKKQLKQQYSDKVVCNKTIDLPSIFANFVSTT